MEDHAIGIQDAIQQATELREHVGADDLVLIWNTEFGDVTLVVDQDGHSLFVNDDPVPMKEQG